MGSGADEGEETATASAGTGTGRRRRRPVSGSLPARTDPGSVAARRRTAGRRGWRGHRALCPCDPGRGAEAGDAEGDAGAGSAAQGRGGQDQRVAAGHSAGSSGHARERRLEKELDEWRGREVSLRQNLLAWAPGLNSAGAQAAPTPPWAGGESRPGCQAQASSGLGDLPPGERALPQSLQGLRFNVHIAGCG